MKKIIHSLAFLLIASTTIGQVLITTGSYSQNFGTSAINSWLNNSTFLGWYNSAATGFAGEENINGSIPTNTGGIYSYKCAGSNTDKKIGSRASGTTGTIRYGVVLKNTTGVSIQSFKVSYTGYQLSIGGNTSVDINKLAFSYIVSPSTILINAGGGTAVTALDYTQTVFSPISTGGQTASLSCTNSAVQTACITANVSNNSYILLRWTDADDGGNDPHLAIDDVNVAFDMSGSTCVNFLPITLTNFDGEQRNAAVQLSWKTATEFNSNYFKINKSTNGEQYNTIGTLQASNTSTGAAYTFTDNTPHVGTNYYTLTTVDFDGSQETSKIIAINYMGNAKEYSFYTEQNVLHIAPTNGLINSISLYTSMGQVIKYVCVNSDVEQSITVNDLPCGVYYVRINTPQANTIERFVKQ